MRFLHIADIQYNVRQGNLRRFVEYEHINKQLIDVATHNDVDCVLIVGDVFEHYNSNSIEESLFIKLLKGLLAAKQTLQIVITAGNHDLKQRDNVFDAGDGSQMHYVDSISKIVAAIDSTRIAYYTESTFYKSTLGVIFAVWAQNAKWHGKQYNPWQTITEEQCQAFKNACVVELYHDPIKNCIAFDGNVVKGNNDDRLESSMFNGCYVAMGDIHKAAIYKEGASILSYAGSPIIRDFGEGDYVVDDKLVQCGATMHGYNIVDIDVATKTVDVSWHALDQLVHYHTVTLTNNVDIDNVKLHNPGKINKIRLRSRVTKPEMSHIVEQVTEKLLASYIVSSLEVQYDSTAIAEINAVTANSNDLLSKVQTIDWQLNAATDWLNAYLDNNAIANEDRQQFADMFMQIVNDALQQVTFDVNCSSYELHKITANQFMALKDVDLSIDALQNLTQVRGNNGNGKTTIFRLIKWLLTGFIDSTQSSATTKQNALSYFNDKLVEDSKYDILQATCEFTHIVSGNATPYRLTRTLERKFKRGNRLNVDGSWRSNIVAVNESVSLLRLTDNYEVPQHEIKTLLYDIFGSIWELSRYVCVNQTLLDQIVSMDSTAFNEWLLDSLGIRTFVELSNTTQFAKDKLFETAAKPSKTTQQLADELQHKLAEQSTLQNDIDALQSDKAKQSSDLYTCRTKIEQLSTLLYQIPTDCVTVEIAQRNVDAIASQLAKKEAQFTELPTVVPAELLNDKATYEQQLATIELSADKAYNDVMQQCITLTNDIAQRKTRLAELETERQKRIAIAKQQMLERHSALQAEYSKASTHINNVLTSLAIQYNAQIEQQCSTYEVEKQRLEKCQVELKERLATIKANIATCKAKLKQLDADTCPVCNGSLTSGAGYSYKLSLSTTIAELDQECQQLEMQLAANANSIATIVNNITACKSKLLVTNDYSTIVAHLTAEHKAAYDKQLEHLAQLQTAIDAAYKQYNNYCSNAKCDEDIEHAIAECMQAIEQLQQQNQHVVAQANAAKAQVLESKPQYAKLLNDVIVKINTITDKITLRATIEQQCTELKLQLQNAKHALESSITYADQRKQNETTSAAIAVAKKSEDEVNAKLLTTNATIAAKQSELAALQVVIANVENDIVAAKQWHIANLVYNAYKLFVSKKGIVAHVFSTIASALNTQLNDLLSELNYRVFFDINDNNVLKMIDLIGNKTVRSVSQMSGMEGTFAGLAIVHLILKQRLNRVGNILLIDEISGKLSNGSITGAETDVNTINYQQVLLAMLNNLCTYRKTLIVDHVLAQDSFSNALVVLSLSDGTSIIKQ